MLERGTKLIVPCMVNQSMHGVYTQRNPDTIFIAQLRVQQKKTKFRPHVLSGFPGRQALPNRPNSKTHRSRHNAQHYPRCICLLFVFQIRVCPFSWGLLRQDVVPVTVGPLGVGANAALLPPVGFFIGSHKEATWSK